MLIPPIHSMNRNEKLTAPVIETSIHFKVPSKRSGPVVMLKQQRVNALIAETTIVFQEAALAG